jgi:hypothetical protein
LGFERDRFIGAPNLHFLLLSVGVSKGELQPCPYRHFLLVSVILSPARLGPHHAKCDGVSGAKDLLLLHRFN